MNFETFAAHHPIGYVLMAYSVVWALLFGYALWIAFQWHRSSRP